jgi:hypothetical protein
MVKENTELEECVDFEMHPFIWCWSGGGRFSIEICRIATKPDCKICSLGQTIRELLPSKLPSFRPGDIHGMSQALQKLEQKKETGNGKRPNVLDNRVPEFNAPLPTSFSKRRIIIPPQPTTTMQQAQQAQQAQKKRKPILIRTPKTQEHGSV